MDKVFLSLLDLGVVGPFDSEEEAIEWATGVARQEDGDYSILPVKTPYEFEVEHADTLASPEGWYSVTGIPPFVADDL